MRLLPINRRTLLVELADLDAVLALHASLNCEPIEGIEELLPAAKTLMVRFDSARLPVETLAAALEQRDLAARLPPGPLVEIPVRYDGEDLAEVAALCGLSIEELIDRHQQSEYRVGFCGFAPGFAYLVGGDPSLHVARRQTPRTQVPKGSVALGGPYCGIYPQTTPGGWQLIGTTSLTLWDPDRTPPALLRAGTRVRFREVAEGPAELAPDDAVARRVNAIDLLSTPEQPSAARLTILTAMLPALLQDLGRVGHAHLGVGASGAADRDALQAANRSVGNPVGLPCLEITLGNFSFESSHDAVIAIVGAVTRISVQSVSGDSREGCMTQPIALKAGDRVTLGYPERGLRSYLAVRGGFAVPLTLGSASRDTLAVIGPVPVVKGSVLAIAPSTAKLDLETKKLVPRDPLPKAGETVVLDVTLGPRADWFTASALALLSTQTWLVTPQSSRVGIRLRGEQHLARLDAHELPSEGLVCGAIQVPHDGQPVLLLADHPVTGGYPVVAVVAEHHLDLAGQIPPGAKIRFAVL